MRPKVAYLVFALLVTASVVTGIDSLIRTERRAQREVNRALALTLRRCEPDRIDADTIRVYRSLITMDGVRDTAYLSMAVTDERRQRATLRANTGLTFGRLWRLSDQRAAGGMAALAALWLVLSAVMMRRRAAAGGLNGEEAMATALAGPSLGALCYEAEARRFVVHGREVRFTPMQQTLMEMFMQAPAHRLTQQDICQHLWPKKPDASATLYTLIRRLKPTLEEATGLKITCRRGDSYQLTDSELDV